MRETEMFPNWRPKLHSPRLPAPALHKRQGLHVYDSEWGGMVPIQKLSGETVRDTRRSAFAKPIA